MTARIRLQFDEGSVLLDLPDLPRVGDGLVLPERMDPASPGVSIYRVVDVVHYPAVVGDLAPMPQRTDVRVLGTLADGPREAT